MAKTKRRKSTFLSFSKKRSKTKKQFDFRRSVLNSAIAVLSLLLIAFIYSFSKQYTQTGIPIEIAFPEQAEPTRLAMEVYEENPVLDIKIEVLNGCGEQGLASKFTDFLRSHRIDVVRSENADHFEYNRTLLIQRNENYEGLKQVAAALGFEISNKDRVLIQPDASSDVDMSLIIGKDFSSIKPYTTFSNH